MCKTYMKLMAYATVVAMVKTGLAMVPFAPADHDVAYWLFTNQVAGTVCTDPESTGSQRNVIENDNDMLGGGFRSKQKAATQIFRKDSYKFAA